MYDAIVLAGGAGRRLGGVDKAAVQIGGTTLLERVLAAVPDAGRIVVVGPARATGVTGVTGPTGATGVDVRWTSERPAGGGPVAALAAALPLVAAEIVIVLAADLPWVAPAVAPLLASLGSSRDIDAAMLVDESGRTNHLAAAWRRAALASALGTVPDPAGAAVRTLTAAARTVLVRDEHGWGRDCDTWDDVAAARAEHVAAARTARAARAARSG